MFRWVNPRWCTTWYSSSMVRLISMLVLTGGLLLGCGVRAPIAKFKGASISESTPAAIAMQIEFEISNTNDEPIQLKMYTYRVSAGGRTIYSGEASAEQTIPRWATIQSSIPFVIRRDSLQSTDQIIWQLSGTLSYIPPNAIAETLLNTGIFKPTTSIRATGVLDVIE